MGQTEATRQSDFTTPPRAGLIAALAVTTAAASQDLRLIGQQTGNMSQANSLTPGLPGHYASFVADGGDVYVIFGATAAAVSSGNAPVVATTGVNTAGVCSKIPNGDSMNVKLEVGVDNFVGYITASGTATLRIAQVSP